MPAPQDDVVWGSASADRRQPGSGRSASSALVTRRTVTLAGGFALAVAATLAVFLTENPKYLQLAVIVMAWAFVLAAFAAGRRGSDHATATAREAQLRQAYELELEREVAARREYELDLEHDLRREAEEVMRDELDALRAEIASLGRLRDEVARVSDLRHDLAGLSTLRDDVARVAALRDDLAALSSLRQDLGQLAELRADMGRLRAELTEQLSSEMLIERIVMRTQGGRFPADQARPDTGRPLDVPASRSDDAPPRELTGGWPAVRLDDPRDLRHAEQVRVDRAVPSRHTPSPPLWSTGPGAPAFPGDAPPPPASTGVWSSAFDRPAPPVPVPHAPSAEPRPWEERRAWDELRAEPPPWDELRPWERDARPTPAPAPVPSSDPADTQRSRHSADGPADMAPAPAPTTESPLEWLAARALIDPVAPPAVPPSPSTALHPSPALRPSPRPRPTPPPPSARLRPDLPPLTRRVEDAETGPITDQTGPITDETGPIPAGGREAGSPRDGDARPTGAPDSDGRLAEILAENGVIPSTGGRRRRRYREDGEPDDVLARVLGLG
jgi:hypothetical protein